MVRPIFLDNFFTYSYQLGFNYQECHQIAIKIIFLQTVAPLFTITLIYFFATTQKVRASC